MIFPFLRLCPAKGVGLLALVLTANCIGLSSTPKEVIFPEVPPPSNDIRMENHIPVRMRDGTVLYADVYRPVKDGKYPVIVSRTPYGVELTYVHMHLQFEV